MFGLPTDVVLFFLATVLVALIGGLGPALLASVAGGLLLNYFLTPPLYSFTIAERENVITMVAMVAVAVAVALVVDRAARRAVQAAHARAEAALLASFARIVLTRSDPLPRLLQKVSEAFGLRSVAILERSSEEDNGWHYAACIGSPDCLRPEDADVDVEVDEDTHLIGQGRPLAAGDRRVLETVGGQAFLALRSQRMATEAATARRLAEGAQLRSALLSAVGHDLRTPLTSIKAAVSSLRDPEVTFSQEDNGELLATVEESVDRLTALVDNLLDSSRLAAGAVVPRLEVVGYDQVVSLALAGVEGGDQVTVEIDETLPHVRADVGLLERVVANLVDNALRHGRGAPVVLRRVPTPTASSYASPMPDQEFPDRRSRTCLCRSRPRATVTRRPGRSRSQRGAGLHRGDGWQPYRGGHSGGGLTAVISLPKAGVAAEPTGAAVTVPDRS